MAKYRPWLVCSLVSAGLAGAVALLYLCVSSLVDGGCPSGSFRHAAVSADSLRCSEIGNHLYGGEPPCGFHQPIITVTPNIEEKKMLQQGGSAVDGAIAALLCTAVVNPQSMGIGGGSIFTIKNKKDKAKVYNFRETVPRTFKTNLLHDCPTKLKMTTGGQWIGIPGELRGYQAVHKQYGKLPWAKLFEPTIKLARDGIPLPPFLGNVLSHPLVKDHVEKSSLCKVFCKKNKTVLSTGDPLKFHKLAETMEIIAKEGADAFYSGKLAQDLVQDIKDAGGTIEMEDLKSYKVRVEDAWTVSLGSAQMHIAPPPAGGALLAFILKLMTGFSLTPNSLNGDQKIQTYHHFVEAVKFANGQRSAIRDPVFNYKKSADHLMNHSFINHIRELISPNRTHDNSYYNVKPSSDHVGTTHVSVLDENGLAVSATSTINQIFGGAVYSPRTGVILNNELSDFCGRADTVRAGEQPPSSMTPAIVALKSGGLIVIGGSGGSMIISAVALTLMNRLWLGMSLKDAIDKPIVFVDAKNNLNFENFFDESVKNGLIALGHKAGDWQLFLNVVNALEKEKGCIVAVSDRRKNGMSAGY